MPKKAGLEQVRIGAWVGAYGDSSEPGILQGHFSESMQVCCAVHNILRPAQRRHPSSIVWPSLANGSHNANAGHASKSDVAHTGHEAYRMHTGLEDP